MWYVKKKCDKKKWLFADDLKAAEVSPIFFQKMMPQRRKTIGLPVFCLTCQRSLKGSCILKLKVVWKIAYPKLLTGFIKNHNTQHFLINMLEKQKNTLDKGGFVCAMFTDLSKAFDKINRDLLIAKLEKYDFQKDAPSFMKSYSDLGNYADGNTFCSCGISLDEVKEILRGGFEIVTK